MFSGDAEMQIRILDLGACARALSVPQELAMNLVVTDLLAERLSSGGWRGVGGAYVWRLGRESALEVGKAINRYRPSPSAPGAVTALD